MTKAYFHHLFGDTARALQASVGSRHGYARLEASSTDARDELTEREQTFLAARDSAYLASVTADGWPYVQHRGGPAGFIRVLGGNRLGFADYPGNRQYISFGNVAESGRVAVFCMDYPARRRLKLIGNARVVHAADEPGLVEQVSHPATADVEAAVLIDVVGFDWNCPRHIEQRFTRAEFAHELRPLLDENAALRAEVTRLRGVRA